MTDDSLGSRNTTPATIFHAYDDPSSALTTAAYSRKPASVLHTGSNRLMMVGYVSPSLFEVLGAQSFLGQAHDLPVGSVVLSYETWRSLYAGATGVVGSAVVVSGIQHTVAGVMQPGFEFPLLPSGQLEGSPHLWVTTNFSPLELTRLSLWRNVSLVLRLPDARPLSDAVASLNEQLFPNDARSNLRFVPINGPRLSSIAVALTVLVATSTVVLLGAFIHLAHVVIGEMRRNDREYRLLSALGASESRRILWAVAPLIPSICLASLMGAFGGVGLLHWVQSLDSRYLPPRLVGGVSPLLIAIGAGFVAAVFLGTVAAIYLRFNRVTSVAAERPRARGTGMSLLFHSVTMTVLSVGAILLASHVRAIQTEDRGFNSDDVLIAGLWFVGKKPEAPALRDSLLRLAGALAMHPGISASAVSSGVPFGVGEVGLVTAGRSQPEASVLITEISDDYFDVLQIRNTGVVPSACRPRSVIISRSLSRRLYGDQVAVGEPIRLERPRRELFVCGVVPDTKDVSTASPGHIYTNLSGERDVMRLLVRTHQSRTDVAELMAQLIAAEVPDAAIQRIAPLNQLFRESTGRLQIIAALGVLFGVCAFVVCLLALMSAVDAAVSSRWRELAIRLALGSTMTAALRHILWPYIAYAFSGVAISASLIVILGPNIYLSFVGATDPKLSVLAVLTSVGLAAVIVLTSLTTSWRAHRIEPSRVLAQL